MVRTSRPVALSVFLAFALPLAAQHTARGGPPQASSCARITGLPSLSSTEDDGLTWAANRRRLQLGQATFGLTVLDTGDWVAEFEGTLYVSRSGGCRWSRLGAGPGVPLRLAAGVGDQALAWGFFAAPQAWLVRADAHGGAVLVPLPDLPADVLALAADPRDAQHVRAVAADGQLYDSIAGGRWTAVGRAAPVSFLVYFGAIDPHDLDHVVIGMVSDGLVTTLDAGGSWTSAVGLSATGRAFNAFNGAISPASSAVVWVMGLDLDENGSGDPNEGKHIYRSDDGGLSFVPVVEHQAQAVLTNGPVLAPHPSDPDVLYFPFGSRFEGGVWLYRYDHATGLTGANFSPDFVQIRALVVDPANPARVLAGFEG
jgi:hypothetical protein